MPPTRDQVFDEIDALLNPTCEVLMVGPFSRTWFRDEGQYYEVLDWLHHRGVTPTVLGDKPFQASVREGASLVPGLRLNYVEGSEVNTAIGMATVCIAFTSRTDAARFTDEEAVQQAIAARKIPTLLMDPEGEVSLL